tara:strand:- start:798 stop:1019 length:222 start_codon:yes stop_codon:yes gene_type:complete
VPIKERELHKGERVWNDGMMWTPPVLVKERAFHTGREYGRMEVEGLPPYLLKRGQFHIGRERVIFLKCRQTCT